MNELFDAKIIDEVIPIVNHNHYVIRESDSKNLFSQKYFFKDGKNDSAIINFKRNKIVISFSSEQVVVSEKYRNKEELLLRLSDELSKLNTIGISRKWVYVGTTNSNGKIYAYNSKVKVSKLLNEKKTIAISCKEVPGIKEGKKYSFIEKKFLSRRYVLLAKKDDCIHYFVLTNDKEIS